MANEEETTGNEEVIEEETTGTEEVIETVGTVDGVYMVEQEVAATEEVEAYTETVLDYQGEEGEYSAVESFKAQYLTQYGEVLKTTDALRMMQMMFDAVYGEAYYNGSTKLGTKTTNSLGNLYLKVNAATEASTRKHTFGDKKGEEYTVDAKPARYSLAFKQSNIVKNALLEVPVEE